MHAEEEAQRYKIGKFILETGRVIKGVEGWGERDLEADNGRVEQDDIQFDSQDEDECEDLFSGIWSPQLALKRREMGIGRRA